MHWFLIPNLWDPFRDSWDLTEANASNTLSTPGYLRPPVRITVQAQAALILDDECAVSQSGRVDPTSVTAFNKPLTIRPLKA